MTKIKENKEIETSKSYEKCCRVYSTWDYSRMPCIREKGHDGGLDINHNAFSNTAPEENKIKK